MKISVNQKVSAFDDIIDGIKAYGATGREKKILGLYAQLGFEHGFLHSDDECQGYAHLKDIELEDTIPLMAERNELSEEAAKLGAQISLFCRKDSINHLGRKTQAYWQILEEIGVEEDLPE